MIDTLQVGDRVKHVSRTEWGLGEVVALESDGMAWVFFEDIGPKKLSLSVAKFTRLEGEESQSGYLSALVERYKKQRVSGLVPKVETMAFPNVVEKFLSFFPDGFLTETYLSGPRSEREYKLSAHQLLTELLNKDTIHELLESQCHSEICDRAKAVINKTNLIHQYEKIWLNNGLASEDGKKKFALALNELLYGSSTFESRFNEFTRMLYDIGAAKWPIATYFPFLAMPDSQFFLKPEVTKNAANILGIDINYKPDLNWLTYSQTLRLADVLRTKLLKEGRPELVPRDMIDVQSFVWVIAPEYF